jgi:hypothetical protein
MGSDALFGNISGNSNMPGRRLATAKRPDDARLVAVAEHVRSWLFGEQEKE